MSVVIESKPTMDGRLVQFSVSDEAIAELRERLLPLQCDSTAGYEMVRRGIAECRDLRVAVESKRKELKEDALKWGRMVDSEAKRITAQLESIEIPLKQRKEAVDLEKERIRQEKAEAIQRQLEEAAAKRREIEEAKLRAEREAEEQRLAAERQRLADEQAKLKAEREAAEAAAKIEREKIEAERAAMEAERQRLAKIEAEKQAAIRAEQEARDKAEREKLDAERRAVEAERQRLAIEEAERQAKIKAELESREQIERERIEAARMAAEEAELKARREAARPDVEKVQAFGMTLLQIVPPSVTTPAAVNEIAAAMKNLQEIGNDLLEFSV